MEAEVGGSTPSTYQGSSDFTSPKTFPGSSNAYLQPKMEFRDYTDVVAYTKLP